MKPAVMTSATLMLYADAAGAAFAGADEEYVAPARGGLWRRLSVLWLAGAALLLSTSL